MMALTVLTVLDAASKEIQKCHSRCQSYIKQSENQGLKNLLLSISDQDRENEKLLLELKEDEHYSILHDKSIEIDISEFSGSNQTENVLNDRSFLLLFSEQKKQLARLFKKIAESDIDEDFTYIVSRIAEVTNRQYILLQDRYDLLVL